MPVCPAICLPVVLVIHEMVQTRTVMCLLVFYTQELMCMKDQQIAELQEQLFHMREQLIAANMDSDKASVSALTQVSLSSAFLGYLDFLTKLATLRLLKNKV